MCRAVTLCLTALLLALAPGCGRQLPATGVTKLKAKTPAELEEILLSRKPDVAEFRARGPFAVTEREDLEIPLPSGLAVEADLYLCAAARKAPLVIVVHGHGNSKDDHVFQALHVASWGMHGLAISLPNHGPWIANGRTLAALVRAIRQAPQLVDQRIDPEKIILVGHSFGATAVAAALGEGAPVVGAVLLDPAGIGRQLPDLLKRITVPVMVVGADEAVWPARNRGFFFRFIPAGVGEVSIRDAVHEDAQSASEDLTVPFQPHPLATEEEQITFVAALTSATFSLAVTGGIDYAWNSFDNAFLNGTFYNSRRK